MCKRGQILPEAGRKAAGRGGGDRLITGASGPGREAFGCSRSRDVFISERSGWFPQISLPITSQSRDFGLTLTNLIRGDLGFFFFFVGRISHFNIIH